MDTDFCIRGTPLRWGRRAGGGGYDERERLSGFFVPAVHSPIAADVVNELPNCLRHFMLRGNRPQSPQVSPVCWGVFKTNYILLSYGSCFRAREGRLGDRLTEKGGEADRKTQKAGRRRQRNRKRLVLVSFDHANTCSCF